MSRENPARPLREAHVRDAAACLDRLRVGAGLDQHEVAAAVGHSPTHVSRLCNRSHPATWDAVDVAMLHGSHDPRARDLAARLVTELAESIGLRVTTGDVVEAEPLRAIAKALEAALATGGAR